MFEYLLKYYIVNRYEFFRNSFEDENPAGWSKGEGEWEKREKILILRATA